MKERTFWIGIILAVSSIAGNYLYDQTQKIGEPIFLEHYIGETIHYTDVDDSYGEMDLTFYYLTDKDDPWTVLAADMNGIEVYNEHTAEFFGNGEAMGYDGEFDHQYLMRASFLVPLDMVFPEGLEQWAFNDMTFHFSNGKTLMVHIGEVLISRKEDVNASVEQVTSSSQSDSDGKSSSYSELIAEEDLSIEGLTLPFKQRIGNDIALSISHVVPNQPTDEVPEWLAAKPYSGNFTTADYLEEGFLPFKVKEGETMQIKSEQNPLIGVHYRFQIGIEARTEDGKEMIDAIHVYQYPYVTEEGIDGMRAERKAGAAE